MYQNKAVRLSLPDGAVLDGLCLGVDDDGALRLQTVGGVRRIHSGDVSLRLQRGA